MEKIKKRLCFWVSVLLFCSVSAFAQTFPTGAILDSALYDSLPQKAVQLSRSYTDIPRAVSLKQYAPTPGNQGQYGTCVGWSTAYAARTIAESIALNRQDRFLTANNVFSPIFVYKGVFSFKNFGIPTGREGIAISYALDFMKSEGAVKRLDFEKTADFTLILLSAFANQRRYRIGDYAVLGGNERVQGVKKSLSEKKPVIIGMQCPGSFFSAKEVWRLAGNEISYGGHAMCVVGYDDVKYGGAFEVLNSWGSDWGNEGYIWIPYMAFNQYVFEAYEIIEDLRNYQKGAEYAGFVRIEVANAREGMPVRFENGYYQTTGSYHSGTRFRYLLGNRKPAYLYAFAGDSGSAETSRIFPPEGQNISPALDYAENIVPFPGEYTWIQLDQRTGADYLVVLYAKEAIDIDAVRDRFSRAGGTFSERVAKAVGSNYIPANQARFESSEMRFTVQSANPHGVFGLLLAIDHR